MTTALVTGGLGFIGSHMVDYLVEQGVEVTAVDDLSTGHEAYRNPQARYLLKDMRQLTAQECHQFDYVFHLAARPRIQPSFEEPVEHELVNVVATVELLIRLRGSPRLRKFVFASSSAVYGDPDRFPTPETCPPRLMNPYALQKYASEQYCLILGRRYGIATVALRYFNVYGPRAYNPQSPYSAYSPVIGIFAHLTREGKTLNITGDGRQSRDFVHVRDVARANWLAATSEVSYEVYNVGSGRPVSILELAKIFGRPYTFIPERPDEARMTWADIGKIRRDLGWEPQVSLEEGIRELLTD